MNLQITNNNSKAQETFLKQLEGLALARDILTANNLNKTAECDTITYKSTSCELSMTNKVIMPKEALQLLSNLEALKEAGKVYFQRNNKKALPDHISEIPKFHESKEDAVELSDSTKETFTRIGDRARKAFIKEQMARADKYNIPYNCYNVNFLELSYKIDHYEMLLEEAKDLGIYWEISDYDPVALEQEIESYKENERKSRDLMYSDYMYSRKVAV
jgi:HEPN domain-containing protein